MMKPYTTGIAKCILGLYPHTRVPFQTKERETTEHNEIRNTHAVYRLLCLYYSRQLLEEY